MSISKQKAIEIFGSITALAKALGITQSAVSQWPDNKPIPILQEMKLKYEILPKINTAQDA